MFGAVPLPRNLDAALRDCRAKRQETRISALRDLTRYTVEESRPQVLEMFRSLLAGDPSEEVRALTAVASADAGLGELRAELVLALEDRSPRVVQMALLALGELVADATVAETAKVRTFLTSELPALRYQALQTTFNWQGCAALELLLDAAKDSDVEMRWLGHHLLGNLVDGAEIDKPSAERIRAFCSTISVSRQEAPHVQVEVGLLLLSQAPSAAWAILEPLLERSKGLESGQVERIVSRLGKAGCGDCRPWLRRRARRGWFEGRLGWISLEALGRLGDREAISAIIAELSASSVARQARALAAVSELTLREAEQAVVAVARSGKTAELKRTAQEVLELLRART